MLLKMFERRQRGYRAIEYDVLESYDVKIRTGKLDFEA